MACMLMHWMLARFTCFDTTIAIGTLNISDVMVHTCWISPAPAYADPFLLVLQLEQSLDATFVFGATSMLGHSPQTPQEMYPNAKGG